MTSAVVLSFFQTFVIQKKIEKRRGGGTEGGIWAKARYVLINARGCNNAIVVHLVVNKYTWETMRSGAL